MTTDNETWLDEVTEEAARRGFVIVIASRDGLHWGNGLDDEVSLTWHSQIPMKSADNPWHRLFDIVLTEEQCQRLPKVVVRDSARSILGCEGWRGGADHGGVRMGKVPDA